MKSSDVHSVPPATVLEFLKHTLPFNELDAASLADFARQCQIDFFPKGIFIFEQGVTEVDSLYLIQKGGVRIFLKDEAGDITLKDFRGEGEYFGALPIIQATRANLNVETVEDTFCFLFAKDAFLALLHSNPRVSQFFLKTMSDRLIRTAYAELRHHKVAPRTESALHLFNVQVGDIIRRELHDIKATDTVQQAAGRMGRHHIGSLLVRDESGSIIGIVTDKDLRNKVVATGRDYQTPVREIMTAPVRTIPHNTVCLDALLSMMGKRIHHLAVEDQGEIRGVVTTHDIMVLQGNSPIYLFREISAQQSLADLAPLARKVPTVVRGLIEEGAKADNISRMITILNDHVLDRILTLLLEELGPPPVPFCWMLMGSEGRREQTFKTDQDNALIYQDPPAERQSECEAYFRTLGERAIEELVRCGYPRCPGDMMASNPVWRKPLSGWQAYFDRLLRTPEPAEVLHATIFFDFRGGFGSMELAEQLRNHLTPRAMRQEIFQHHLAHDCLEARPPISFFKNFIVEKDGEHKNQLDLKSQGLVPFVDFARLFALRHGVKETNTSGRLRLLHERGFISRELFSETIEAYEFIMQLRLVHQLQRLEQELQPDNYISPADLTDLEKKTLKEAFAVIQRLQSVIRYEFRLGTA